MRVFKTALIALALFSASTLASTNGADGFIVVQLTQYKMSSDGSFVYCDKPDVQKISCRDEMIRGLGDIEGESEPSNWRSADQYVKYLLSDDFNYVGMTALNHSLALYYKRNAD